MVNNIKISIVTPSFNQGNFIEETILSVLNQSYKNYEHIIVDGGSTDNSLDIFKNYSHLNWISERDKGQSDALNKGFLKASGEWILWLNSDDILEPDALIKFVNVLNNNPESNVIHGYVKFFDDKSKKVFKRQYFTDFKKNRTFFRVLTHPSSGTFYRTNFLQQNLLDLDFHYMMDTEWSMRCASQIKLSVISDFTVQFRVSDTNKTSEQIKTGKLNSQQIKESNILYDLYVKPIMSRYPKSFRPYFYKLYQSYYKNSYRFSKLLFYAKDFFYYEK